jgi:hypothetical protein
MESDAACDLDRSAGNRLRLAGSTRPYHFDWSHEAILLSGTTVVVKTDHIRLCHGRMLFVLA